MDYKKFDCNNEFIKLIKHLNSEDSTPEKHKYAKVTTYGCQGNVSDSEHIKGILELMGYEFTDDEAIADLAIYNTCAVREHAEQRVFGNVGALKNIKASRPSMVIAVCGCMTEQPQIAEKIKKSYPYVDLVFGTHGLDKFPEMLYRAMTGKRVFELTGEDKVIENLPTYRDSSFKASVPITYGCNNFCTYCIVPYVRGRERSRKSEDIVKEVTSLVKTGAKEITLLGQNVNSYGKTLENKTSFSELLSMINDIDGDFIIRFMTSHPKDATEELFDTIAKCKKIVHHLHLPFQCGSSDILRKMNRGYTKEQYLDLIKKLRERVPDISLTSDIIVGFPGETYEDFKQTLDVIKQVEFDNLYTFIYSPREGTPAAKLPDSVTHAEKAKWMGELLELQDEIVLKRMNEQVGKTVRVLCENYSEGMISSRSGRNFVVKFEGDESLVSNFCEVKITKAKRAVLIGELVK